MMPETHEKVIRSRLTGKPTLLAFFIAVLFATAPLESTIVPALDVAALTAGADTIVIGQIISVTGRGPTSLDPGGGPIPATDFEAVLRVDRVLKGTSWAQTLTLDFTLPQMPSGMRGVVTDQYGVFFLTETQNRFRFTDPIYPALPAFRNVNLSSGTALDQVTTVLAQVFEAAQVSESDRISALDALGGLNTDLARDTLRHALNNSSHHLRLGAAATLVAHNDMSGLATVEDALLHSPGLSETMLSNLAGSLGGLHDPRAIPALKRLLETNNQDITKGAAIALRQSRSPDALAPLSHLLENSDERVRYYAVVGMGEITKQDEWTPAFDEFRDHEVKYLPTGGIGPHRTYPARLQDETSRDSNPPPALFPSHSLSTPAGLTSSASHPTQRRAEILSPRKAARNQSWIDAFFLQQRLVNRVIGWARDSNPQEPSGV